MWRFSRCLHALRRGKSDVLFRFVLRNFWVKSSHLQGSCQWNRTKAYHHFEGWVHKLKNYKFSRTTNWNYRFGCVYTDMPKVLKIRSLHIYAISPEKHRVKVVLWPADKYQNFLQADSILDVCDQACPRYPK